jgi:hypothetical protein
MADIVVLDTTQPTDVKKRQSGMKLLGETFNKYFQMASLTDDEIVNKTIQEIIATGPPFIVTYKTETNVLSVKGPPHKGKYYYKPGDPSAILKLRATRDKKDKVDGEDVDVMHIALSEGNANLLTPSNYLSKVITDLGATDSADRRKYLLGTITFRRCR